MKRQNNFIRGLMDANQEFRDAHNRLSLDLFNERLKSDYYQRQLLILKDRDEEYRAVIALLTIKK